MYSVQSVIKHLPSQKLNDILIFTINLLSSLSQMVMTYFEALKKWNLGGAAWCIPRKDTINYKHVKQIQSGEIESKQDIIKKELEKYKKKPTKKEKTSVNIKI